MNDDVMSAVDRPRAAAPGTTRWGSDVIAAMLRALDVEFIALTPGASFRGLHDSLVNHLGNTRPEMLLALHEEHAVAMAHGYARVTGRPMAVALHSNVGLMHATMAIFNAWCDRVPILMLGGVGPMDAVQRRPWVDWIHTSRDLGALVRGYTKWDDQPASVGSGTRSDGARAPDRDDGAARTRLRVSRRIAPGSRSSSARSRCRRSSDSGPRSPAEPPADAVRAVARTRLRGRRSRCS